MISNKPKDLKFAVRYPCYHPRKRELTCFPEKIWKSLYTGNPVKRCPEELNSYINRYVDIMKFDLASWYDTNKKGHTIRAGSRFKEGDYFIPRIWTARPFWPGLNGNPAVIDICYPLQVKRTYHIEINPLFKIKINHKKIPADLLSVLAKNDGLTVEDFKAWFNKPAFSGQIIVWDENIQY